MNLLRRKPRGFVLALAGGGGRGLAHLGVFKALEENQLRPDAIVGTSIGALFGAMYALNPDAEDVRERVFTFLHSDVFQSIKLPIDHDVNTDAGDDSWFARMATVARQTVLYSRAMSDISVADASALSHVAQLFCASGSFESAKIPIHVTAVHYPRGERKLFSRGDLCMALAASMAVPGVFEPVVIDGERYLDGGLSSEVPSMEARSVAGLSQVVLAVNTGASPDPKHEPGNVLGMLDWAAQVKSLYLRKFQKMEADVVIEPLVGLTQWYDFSNSDDEVGRGYEAALEVIPELRRQMRR